MGRRRHKEASSFSEEKEAKRLYSLARGDDPGTRE
jgi:hypothetical protein